MQALSCLTLLLVTTVCLSHTSRVSLYKTDEKDELLKVENWQEDLLNQVASVQVLQDGEGSQGLYQEYTRKNDQFPASNNSNLPDDQENEAYIDAGELVLLEGNLSATHRQDALASSLFAQLASDYKYSRTASPKEWAKEYGTVLGKVGWVLIENSFEQIEVHDFFVISEVILTQFANKFSQLDEEVLHDLRCLLNSFGELNANDQDVEILYNKSYGGHGSVNFAVNVYNEVDGDSVNMLSLRTFFNVCEMSRSYLFHLFESECVGGKVHIEVSQYKLDKGTYSKVRNTIKSKLGDRMSHYVIKLKLKD